MGVVSWTRGTGPLAPFAEGFCRELLEVGHPPAAVKHHLVLMGQLNGWLAGEDRDSASASAASAARQLRVLHRGWGPSLSDRAFPIWGEPCAHATWRTGRRDGSGSASRRISRVIGAISPTPKNR